jgi:hypothetical protein
MIADFSRPHRAARDSKAGDPGPPVTLRCLAGFPATPVTLRCLAGFPGRPASKECA